MVSILCRTLTRIIMFLKQINDITYNALINYMIINDYFDRL